MTAKLEAQPRRIGEGHGPSYRVANLASLMTVCAVALDGSTEWTDEIARRIREDVKHVLEWGALLAIDVCEEVETLESRSKK